MTNKENAFINKSRWDYQNCFREYLLLLANKGSIGLERPESFPDTIELSQGWHDSLNKMREESRDGYERWLFVGYGKDLRNLYISNKSVKGSKDSISGKMTNEVITKAKKEFGIVNMVGDIHSHPDDFLQPLLIQLMSFKSSGILKCNYSPTDYYYFLTTSELYFQGLVEGNYNLFAFKTSETKLGIDPTIFKEEHFSKYWVEKNFSSSKINTEIATKHKIVLYQGYENKDLIKIRL